MVTKIIQTDTEWRIIVARSLCEKNIGYDEVLIEKPFLKGIPLCNYMHNEINDRWWLDLSAILEMGEAQNRYQLSVLASVIKNDETIEILDIQDSEMIDLGYVK